MFNYLLFMLLAALTNNSFLLINLGAVLLAALLSGVLSKRFKGFLPYIPIISYFLFFGWSIHQLI